jgi:excisionase family DNA binding protein
MKPIFMSVSQASQSLGLGVTKIYELVAAGALRSAKIGARRLILIESMEDLAAGLMAEQVQKNSGEEF